MSYNFAGGSHLANQNQNICIRRERNICRICWTTQNDIDFQLSGMTTKMAGLVVSVHAAYKWLKLLQFWNFLEQGLLQLWIQGYLI